MKTSPLKKEMEEEGHNQHSKGAPELKHYILNTASASSSQTTNNVYPLEKSVSPPNLDAVNSQSSSVKDNFSAVEIIKVSKSPSLATPHCQITKPSVASTLSTHQNLEQNFHQSQARNLALISITQAQSPPNLSLNPNNQHSKNPTFLTTPSQNFTKPPAIFEPDDLPYVVEFPADENDCEGTDKSIQSHSLVGSNRKDVSVGTDMALSSVFQEVLNLKRCRDNPVEKDGEIGTSKKAKKETSSKVFQSQEVIQSSRKSNRGSQSIRKIKKIKNSVLTVLNEEKLMDVQIQCLEDGKICFSGSQISNGSGGSPTTAISNP